MSYSKFQKGVSDVYVILDSNDYYQCIGCLRSDLEEDADWFSTDKPEKMLTHLHRHRQNGDLVPDSAFKRLKSEVT